jgi:tetratricopeptide (TPR) repeat protein
MSSEANRQERLVRARELRQRGEAARRRDGVTAQKCYEEAVALYREGGEPLVLAHVVRHLGDVYQEQERPDLAEPCYHEALRLYRDHEQGTSLDLANAIRSLAVLRWEQTRELWKTARDLYANLSVEAGVEESKGRLEALSKV